MRPKFSSKPQRGEYNVTIPFTGYVSINVPDADADSEDDAQQKAWDILGDMSVDEQHEATCEFEYHDIVAEGNVYHGVLNEMSVDLEGPPVEE